MADCSAVMSEANISALKETLMAQQQLLQKLYSELDAEREASATAASEALSVILRLQEEKAAVKMEAEQYKRLSEEKMCHAEESLAIIEDIIYQKEMEVAALNHQVQAYRYKLLSMGGVDPENLLQRNDSLSGDIGFQSIGRWNSAPVSFKYKKAINEGDCCTGQELDLIPKVVEKQTGDDVNDLNLESDNKMDDSTSGDISSYWDQIRKLDNRVKEIAGLDRSPSSASSTNVKLLKNNSTNVHDVFEVPQLDQRIENKPAFQGSWTDKRENAVHPEAANLYDKDEPKWMKNVSESNYCESNLHKESDTGCHLAVDQRSNVSESNQLDRTSEIIEAERLEDSTDREEELNLLNEIKEQLNSLHNEITSWNVKKSSRREEPAFCALREAMLYFWL